jgi:hypothetical protein
MSFQMWVTTFIILDVHFLHQMKTTTKRYLCAILRGSIMGPLLIVWLVLPKLASTGRPPDMTLPALVFPYAFWAYWILAEILQRQAIGTFAACALLQFPIYAALYVRAQSNNRVPFIVVRILFLHFLIAAGVAFLYSTGAGPFSPP